MTIVKELNDLAEKMTGTNPNKKTIAKVLDYIEQNYTAGGGSGSGGSSAESDIFIVRGSTSDNIHYTTDKTYEELVEAKNSGKIILYTDGVSSTFLNTFATPEGFPQLFIGDMLYNDTGSLVITTVTINPSGIGVVENTYALTPSN